MTSNTLHETVPAIDAVVQRSLRDSGYGSYFSYAGAVVEALQKRERGIAEMLVDYAVDAGADQVEIRSYLREIGMTVAEDDPEPEDGESAEPEDVLTRIDARLNSLVETVDGLAQFARNNGYRG